MDWNDFVMVMTTPRIGWLSASGMVALALLALAGVKFAANTASVGTLVLAGLINLTALALDYQRNGRR